MSITRAQIATQLLNEMAPKGEKLAYINNREAELLKRMGGAGKNINERLFCTFINLTIPLLYSQFAMCGVVDTSSFFKIKDLISLATKISLKVSLNNSLNHFYTKSRNVMLNWIINERKRQIIYHLRIKKLTQNL